MSLDREEVIELKRLIKFSIDSGYNTNLVTKKLAHELLTKEELEDLELDNIGISSTGNQSIFFFWVK